MVIITDCLTEQVDEGSLKVANSLTKRIKAADHETNIIAYGRHSQIADHFLKLNKLFLNPSLYNLVKDSADSVLYIPFSSNTMGSALRTLVLSRMCKCPKVVFVLRHKMNAVTRWILKCGNAQIIVLSQDSYDYYRRYFDHVVYLRTGVDTKQFVPVSQEKKISLRRKYGLPEDRKIVLHVGHCNAGRNIQVLLNVGEEEYVCLVISSVTRKNKDAELENLFRSRRNARLIDVYLENIEELYQLSDVYVFPTLQMESCIDVPLSVLEAAACNIPVITSDYGELKAFRGKEGFYFLSDFSSESLNAALNKAYSGEIGGGRDAVLDYDWEKAVMRVMKL